MNGSWLIKQVSESRVFMTQPLEKKMFKMVISSVPLIAIDLIIYNDKGEVLLGYRTNRPAKGYWFVPGGRVRKNETLEQAFDRISKVELGQLLKLTDATCLGPYEHFYQDNYFGSDDSTHYVVLGYQIEADISCQELPTDQHQEFKWWRLSDLLNSQLVHRNTKAYFSDNYKQYR